MQLQKKLFRFVKIITYLNFFGYILLISLKIFHGLYSRKKYLNNLYSSC
jgi:hypothetical protein